MDDCGPQFVWYANHIVVGLMPLRARIFKTGDEAAPMLPGHTPQVECPEKESFFEIFPLPANARDVEINYSCKVDVGPQRIVRRALVRQREPVGAWRKRHPSEDPKFVPHKHGSVRCRFGSIAPTGMK